MSNPNFLSAHQNKRLNQVVFPGSHDAGIYGRDQVGSTALTQDLNIFLQAMCGVRWFDVRIAGQMVNGNVEHRAFHTLGGWKKEDSTSNLNYKKGVLAGGYGGRLDTMLGQAKDFLTNYPSEFLIFKISKSQNIESIFDTCLGVMGEMLYKSPQSDHDLNKVLVSDLAGHLILLVSEEDASKIRDHVISTAPNPQKGGSQLFYTRYLERLDYVFKFRELLGKKGVIKAYIDNYRGLQYFGKYSDTPSYSDNAKKQSKNIAKGRALPGQSQHAMGVMYWTLTSGVKKMSLFDSIEKRNKKLWTDRHVRDLESIWSGGLQESMRTHMGDIRFMQPQEIHDIAQFIPNVIMLDFANSQSCRSVIALNAVPSQVVNRLRLHVNL